MQVGDSPVLFSKALRAGTKRKLTATRSLNNLTIPVALSSPQVYLIFLRAYGEIFSVFEEEFEKRRRIYPRLNAIYFRELLRTSAFTRDIAYYTNDNEKKHVPLVTVDAFIAEMQQSLARKPILIVSYSYALYLGLYVASPRIQAFIRNAFDIAEVSGAGTGIWDFSGTIKNRGGFRKRYNTAMDDFELEDDEKADIIKHALKVLDSSNRIFQEIRFSYQYKVSLAQAALRATGGLLVVAWVAWVFFRPFAWSVAVLLGFRDV